MEPSPQSRDMGLRKRLTGTSGSQIVEFAVSLPLLVVFIVGIFDFGGAFTLKAKIGSAAVEGARVASNQATTDLLLSGPPCNAPASICAVRDVVDNSLVANKVNDCGLASAVASSAGALAWTFPANGSCPGVPYLLKIERGATTTVGASPPLFPSGFTIELTKVTIIYPYKWQFNRVIQLLAPGATYAGTTQITYAVVMQNLN